MDQTIRQNLNLGQLIPEFSTENFEVDQAVIDFAQQLLTYGEYLSYAKYAKYVPGAPAALSNRAVSWMGDSCKLVNAGLKIKPAFGGFFGKGKFRYLVCVCQFDQLLC